MRLVTLRDEIWVILCPGYISDAFSPLCERTQCRTMAARVALATLAPLQNEALALRKAKPGIR